VPPISTNGFVYLKWKNLAVRRYREMAKLRYKVKRKGFWRAIRVIPSNISKYAEMRRIVFSRICKYLRSLNKKFGEINSTITDFVDDSHSVETLLQHLYGKMKIHSANAESYHEILNYESYVGNSCENMFENINESVNLCINDILSKICGTKSWKRNKVRKCTDRCEIPSNWGKKLHDKLAEIVELLYLIDCDISKTDVKQLNRKLREVQEKFTAFEFCSGCYNSRGRQCTYGDLCKDNLSWINALSIHFSGVRTVRRQIYSLRKAIYWLNMTDHINRESDYDALMEMLNNPDIQLAEVRQMIEKAALNSEYIAEADINRQFGVFLS